MGRCFFPIFLRPTMVSNLDHLASKVLNQDRVVCSLSIDVNTICCIISHNLPLVLVKHNFLKAPHFDF